MGKGERELTMGKRLVVCLDLKTKVGVSFIVLATLWGPKTKHEFNTLWGLEQFKQRQVPTKQQTYNCMRSSE